MSNDEIVVFLPCRAGSERVPHKNTRPFAGDENGLLGIKLMQLESVQSVASIILDSNDDVVLERGESIRKRWRGPSELLVRERPDHLGASNTTTDALIAYALADFADAHMLWTHVTSPFIQTDVYERMIQEYKDKLSQGYDSLMTVNKLQTFLWGENGPMNYKTDELRWPRTQDIQPVYEVNSGAFMVPSDTGKKRGDRIGEKPYLFELSHAEAFDIDWPADFEMAQKLWIRGEKE